MLAKIQSFLLFLFLFPFVVVSQEAQCASEVHELVKPFAGTWHEFTVKEDGSEEFIGILVSKRDTKDCALYQTFTSPDSSFFYRTLGYVDPISKMWVETYVFSTGSVSNYQWIVDNGNIVQRRVGGSRQMDHMHQLRFVDVTENSYALIQEKSSDGGKNWEQTERTNIRKVSD